MTVTAEDMDRVRMRLGDWERDRRQHAVERFCDLARHANAPDVIRRVSCAVSLAEMLADTYGTGRLLPANSASYLDYKNAVAHPLRPAEVGCVLATRSAGCVGVDIGCRAVVACDGHTSVGVRDGSVVLPSGDGTDWRLTVICEAGRLMTVGHGMHDELTLAETEAVAQLACAALDGIDELCDGLTSYAEDVMAGCAVDLTNRDTWR